MTAFRLALLMAILFQSTAFSAGLAQNENFIVLTPAKPSQEAGKKYAQLVLKNAAEFRSAFAQEWLGGELSEGAGKTIISVQFSEIKSSGRTWAKDAPGRQFHNVFLHTSAERAAGTMLCHEVAHTVLATRYPHPNRLPPWAEEGIASRYDDDSLIAVREQTVATWLRTGSIPMLAGLLEAPSIASYDDNYYAAAESLVNFLLTRGDKATVLRFAADGQRYGWHYAVKTHYALGSVGELQSEWQNWLVDSARQ